MDSYPIMLNAPQIHALIIGAGSVGLRKIETLIKCGVRDIVIADKNILHGKVAELTVEFELVFFQQSYDSSLLEGRNLVFICTDDAFLNSCIVKECANLNLFCNVVTQPSEGTFTLPALIEKDDIMVTLSTKGQSPALSRVLKEDIEVFLDRGYVQLCAFLGKIRPLLLELHLPSDENGQLLRKFVSSPLKEDLLFLFTHKSEKNEYELMKIFKENLPHQLHSCIGELLCSSY